MVLFLSLMVIVILGPFVLVGILWPIFDKNFVDKMVEETKNNPERPKYKTKSHWWYCSHDWRYYAAKNGFGPKNYK